MKLLFRTLLILILPAAVFAHPGGALIALNANTVIFGDPANNVLWRLEKGKKPSALMNKLHVHWTTLGMDGKLYAESFQEMGGALFRVDVGGSNHIKVAEEADVNAPVFVVGRQGEIIFQKGEAIFERSAKGVVRAFRGSGRVAKNERPLSQIIAYSWGSGGTLYLSDGGDLRRIGKDGVIRFVALIEGKLLDRQIWNSTGAPRIWSIAVNDKKQIFTALPDLGQVVRIDADGSQHIIDRYAGGWRVTAVAVFKENVFLLESSDKSNAGQRVRVIRGTGTVELLGQVENNS